MKKKVTKTKSTKPKLNVKKVSKKDFRSYQNDTIPYLRLIKNIRVYTIWRIE